MRVVHVVGNLNYGGPQIRVLGMIRELPGFDHVVVFQSRDDGQLYSEYARAADLRRIPRHKDETIRSFGRMTRLLREIAPDAVLAHQFGNHALVAWAAFVARVPVTFGVSTTDPVHYAGSRWKPALLAQLGRPVCDGEIAVSQAIADVLVSKLRLPRKRVTVIHNGCPVERIAARAAAARANANMESRPVPRIVMIGAISRTKDYATVIKCVDVLRKRGRPVEFLAVGGAFRVERMAAVESLVAQLELSEFVKFLGPRSDIAELLGASDVAVHASLSEGLPVAVLEAMAARTPVVATDIPANREALDDGRCGILVPERDPQSLADAIEGLLHDHDKRSAMVSAAEERVRARFDLRVMARSYARLLESACDRSGRNA